MNDKELIETLKLFEKEKVENLPESARNLFYAIMKIADERDEYKKRINKAIEYIKKDMEENKYENRLDCYYLLNILKGE